MTEEDAAGLFGGQGDGFEDPFGAGVGDPEGEFGLGGDPQADGAGESAMGPGEAGNVEGDQSSAGLFAAQDEQQVDFGAGADGLGAEDSSHLFGEQVAQNEPDESAHLFGQSQQAAVQNEQEDSSHLFGEQAAQNEPESAHLFGDANQTAVQNEQEESSQLFGEQAAQNEQEESEQLFGDANQAAVPNEQEESAQLFGETEQGGQEESAQLFGDADQAMVADQGAFGEAADPFGGNDQQAEIYAQNGEADSSQLFGGSGQDTEAQDDAEDSAQLFGGANPAEGAHEAGAETGDSSQLFGGNGQDSMIEDSAQLFNAGDEMRDLSQERQDSAELFGNVDEAAADLFGGQSGKVPAPVEQSSEVSQLFGQGNGEEYFGAQTAQQQPVQMPTTPVQSQPYVPGNPAPVPSQPYVPGNPAPAPSQPYVPGNLAPTQSQTYMPGNPSLYVPGVPQASQTAAKPTVYVPGFGGGGAPQVAPPPVPQGIAAPVSAAPPAAPMSGIPPAAPSSAMPQVYVPGGFQTKANPPVQPTIFTPTAPAANMRPPEMPRQQVQQPGHTGTLYIPGLQADRTTPAPSYVPGQVQRAPPAAPGYIPGAPAQPNRPAVFSPAQTQMTPSAPPPMTRPTAPPPMTRPVSQMPEQVQEEKMVEPPKPSYVPGLAQIQQQEAAKKPTEFFQPEQPHHNQQTHTMHPPPMMRPPPMAPQPAPMPEAPKLPPNMPKFDLQGPAKVPANMPKFDMQEAPKRETPAIMTPGVVPQPTPSPAGFQKPPQFTAPPKMPTMNAPPSPFSYLAPMQPVAADSKPENFAVPATQVMSRSVTTNEISEASHWGGGPAPVSGSQPFIRSVSSPCDVVHSNIPFFTKHRPINAFGFGGLIVRSQGDSVVLQRVQDLYCNDRVIEQLATFSGGTQPGQVETYINDRLTKCECEEDALLWQTIGVRASHAQAINPAAFHQNLRIHGSSEQRLLGMLADSARTSDVSPSFSETPVSEAQLEELQKIITENGDRDALEFAIKNAMWPFAMIIASAISANEMQRVSSLFVSQSLSPCPLARVLNSLSGVDSNVDEHNWKDTLCTALKHYGSNTSRIIRSIGQFLESCGNMKLAHMCKLLASDQLEGPQSQFALVGTDWNHPTITAIQMSQLSMKTPTTFYPYALYYTMALIDFGFTDKAKQNSDRLKERFEREKNLSFLHVTDIFQKKLDRITRKPDDGVVKALFRNVDKLLTGLVAGQDQPPEDMYKTRLPTSVSTDSAEPTDDYNDPFGGGMEDMNDTFASPPVIAPQPVPMPVPQPAVPERKPQPAPPAAKPAPKPEELKPAKKEEKDGQKSGFLGRFISHLNPFKKAIEVDLSQHDGEMVWNGTSWVRVGGGDEDEASAPPPPPPRARVMSQPQHVPQAPQAPQAAAPPPSPPMGPPPSGAPPPSGTRQPDASLRSATGRTRAAGRYVASF